MNIIVIILLILLICGGLGGGYVHSGWQGGGIGLGGVLLIILVLYLLGVI